MLASAKCSARIIHKTMLEIFKQRRGIIRTILPLYACWRFLDASFVFLAFGKIAPAANEAHIQVWPTFMNVVVACVFAPFLAVLWHRLVLLPKRYWPEIRQVGHYLVTLILQMFLILLLLMPLLVWMWFADHVFASSFLPIPARLGDFVFGTLIVWFTYRIGVTLPAVAIGNDKVGLAEAWGATKGLSWPLVWLASVTALLESLIGALTQYAASVSGVTGLLANYALSPVSALFGLGLLTTLYSERIDARQNEPADQLGQEAN